MRWSIGITRQILGAAALVVIAGCSTSTGPKSGGLTVRVDAPAGVTPSVTITGPNGIHQTITTTEHLTGLAPGVYTITAANVSVSGPIVTTVYTAVVRGSPDTVAAGSIATATVTYAARGGTGALWVVASATVGTSSRSAALEFAAKQLEASGSPTPAVTLNLPVPPGGYVDANGLAFDKQGDLWVVNSYSNTVVEYPPSQLGANGNPTPAVTLQLPAKSAAAALAFDTNGNLWVANEKAYTIVEFSAAQLATSGSPTPAVTLAPHTLSAGVIVPLSLAFDSHGDLWVVNLNEAQVIAFTPSALASSGSPLPSVVISGTNLYPYNLAFDSTGNLWLATIPYTVNSTTHPGNILEFASASLAASGTPSAVTTLSLPGGPSAFPSGLAFDNSGDLWYGDFAHPVIGEFTAAQLTAGGNPSPEVTVSTGSVFPAAIAFDPSRQ